MIEETTPRRTKRIVIILVISIIASCSVLGGALYIKIQQEDALRGGLVEGCKKNGNPLRAIAREDLNEDIHALQDEIKESESVDLEKFFPNTPPEELQAEIRKQNEDREHRIKRKEERRDILAPVDCEAQYK